MRSKFFAVILALVAVGVVGQFNATAQDTSFTGSKPGGGALSQTVARSTATVSVTNTTTETTFFSASVPASTLGTNKRLRFLASIALSTSSTSPGNLTIRSYYGSSAATVVFTGLPTSLSSRRTIVEVDVLEKDNSASAQYAWLRVRQSDASGTDGTSNHRLFDVLAALAVNANLVQTFKMTAQFSVATPANVVAFNLGWLELLN